MNNLPDSLSDDLSHNERIEELETKLTFQDHLIDELNQALIMQQSDITKLTNLLESVISQVEKMGSGNNQEDQIEVPPHY